MATNHDSGAVTAFLARIGVLVAGTLGTAALAFVTQLLLTRNMSLGDYGRLAALLSAANVLAPLAAVGIGWFWLDLFGREGYRAFRWMPVALRVGSIAMMCCVLLLAAYVLATHDHDDTPSATYSILCLVPLLIGQSLADSTSARLQLEERYTALACWQMLTQLSRAILAVLLVTFGKMDLLSMLAAFGAVGLFSSVISAASLRDMLGGRIHVAGHDRPAEMVQAPQPTMTELLSLAMPYTIVIFFYLVGTYGIVAIVGALLSSESTAVFNVAFLVISLVCLVPNVVYVKFLASKLLRWWNHDREMFTSVFHVGLLAHLVMGIICAVLLIGLAPVVVPLLFGPQYAASVPVLMIMALGIPIRFVQHSYGSLLFSSEHIRRKIFYMGVAASTAVLLNFLLIPFFDLRGAAAAGVVTELVLLALYMNGASRYVEGIDVKASFRPSILRSSLRYVTQRR